MLDHFREIYYLYADVSCAAYPMTNIDTIMDDGRIDRKSALHYAVYGVTNKYNYSYEANFVSNLKINCVYENIYETISLGLFVENNFKMFT